MTTTERDDRWQHRRDRLVPFRAIGIPTAIVRRFIHIDGLRTAMLMAFNLFISVIPTPGRWNGCTLAVDARQAPPVRRAASGSDPRHRRQHRAVGAVVGDPAVVVQLVRPRFRGIGIALALLSWIYVISVVWVVIVVVSAVMWERSAPVDAVVELTGDRLAPES